MSELPKGWVEATFDDVAVVAANLVEPAEYQAFPHIAPNHIESGSGRLLPYTTVEGDRVISPKHLFGPGQILYSKIRPYLAKAVLVDFTGLCSADMYPIDTALEPKFLFRWMLGSTFTEMASRSQGRTVLPKINKNAVGVLPVPVPPLNEQRRIVAKIDALTEKSRQAREALDAVPELLDKLRQSILAAAFRGDLTKKWREQNPEVEPASVLLERIRKERRKKWEEAELAKFKAKGKVPKDDSWKAKYEEPQPVDTEGLPELPEGWCWVAAELVCSEVVDCHNKTAPYSDSGIPLIRTTNIRNGRISLVDTKFVSEETYERWSRRCPPRPGDVIFTREAPMGEAGMVPSNATLCMGQRMMLLRPNLGVLAGEYLLFAVQGPHVDIYADKVAVGTGVKHLRVKDVEGLPIPLAPVLEQKAVLRAIVQAFEHYRGALSGTEQLTSALEGLDSSILAKAFRGELVPQDPNDEPASVLLDRIRAERENESTATKGAKGRPRRTQGA